MVTQTCVKFDKLLFNFVNRFSDKQVNEDLNLALDSDERTRRNLELLERCKKLTNKLTTSMARSDLGLTTWSKLKKQTVQSPLKRYISNNKITRYFN